MTTEEKVIAELSFHADKPTCFSFATLHRWIIWQFPRPHQDGMMGAVHPPLPEYSWLPAIIRAKSKDVVIHAHVDVDYQSPETAVAHFEPKLKTNDPN